jgi:hypothetical protein
MVEQPLEINQSRIISLPWWKELGLALPLPNKAL